MEAFFFLSFLFPSPSSSFVCTNEHKPPKTTMALSGRVTKPKQQGITIEAATRGLKERAAEYNRDTSAGLQSVGTLLEEAVKMVEKNLTQKDLCLIDAATHAPKGATRCKLGKLSRQVQKPKSMPGMPKTKGPPRSGAAPPHAVRELYGVPKSSSTKKNQDQSDPICQSDPI